VGHVTLAVLCAATSLFTDLGTGQSTEHALRTCLIAMRLTAGLGFGTEACREVLYVSLLRLLGYTADAHQAAGLAGGDEIGFLAGMAPVKATGSPHEEIARLIGLVAAEEAMPRRLRLGAGGEIKGNGSTGHGNRYLARVLGEAAVAAGRTDSFLGARYRRIARRRGRKKAMVTVGRSLRVIIWHLLADPNTRFHELGADHYDRHVNTHAKRRNHIRQLEALGYRVTLEPAA
jgi:hypothetical protein